MNAYKFTLYTTDSLVASGVTLLVSAWFLVAAGAILTDPASPYTQPRAQATAGPAVQLAEAAAAAVDADIADGARLTIHVEASRSAT